MKRQNVNSFLDEKNAKIAKEYQVYEGYVSSYNVECMKHTKYIE